ncbi:MAG: hypothetical protein N3B01_06895, partial [Verrucomicrobiae bacterium]|nr:hypothetical protein [Verrucomicrobiae bacterium]
VHGTSFRLLKVVWSDNKLCLLLAGSATVHQFVGTAKRTETALDRFDKIQAESALPATCCAADRAPLADPRQQMGQA